MQSAGPQVERIMAALKRADVLKEDRPGYPTHYNRAYSAVMSALIPDNLMDLSSQEQQTFTCKK